MFIHSRSFPENHTRFQTKMGKSLPFFWPERPKIHTLWGSTNLYGLYKEVTPPPPPPPTLVLGEPGRHKWSTVKRCTDTSLIWTPRCYGQFPVSRGKESPYIFSYFNPRKRVPFQRATKEIGDVCTQAIKWEIIWTSGLPHLSGLSHQPPSCPRPK